MQSKGPIAPRVAQFVEMCDFPCKKEDLLLTAEECQFPDDVVNVCEDLPNKEYESEQDVIDAVEQLSDIETPQKTRSSARQFR